MDVDVNAADALSTSASAGAHWRTVTWSVSRRQSSPIIMNSPFFFLFFFFFNLCPKHLRISIKNQNHRLVKFNQLSRLSRNQFNSNRSTWSSSIWIEDWFREQPSHLFHFFRMIRLKFAWNGDSRWYETLKNRSNQSVSRKKFEMMINSEWFVACFSRSTINQVSDMNLIFLKCYWQIY